MVLKFIVFVATQSGSCVARSIRQSCEVLRCRMICRKLLQKLKFNRSSKSDKQSSPEDRQRRRRTIPSPISTVSLIQNKLSLSGKRMKDWLSVWWTIIVICFLVIGKREERLWIRMIMFQLWCWFDWLLPCLVGCLFAPQRIRLKKRIRWTRIRQNKYIKAKDTWVNVPYLGCKWNSFVVSFQ